MLGKGRPAFVPGYNKEDSPELDRWSVALLIVGEKMIHQPRSEDMPLSFSQKNVVNINSCQNSSGKFLFIAIPPHDLRSALMAVLSEVLYRKSQQTCY